MDTNLKSCVLTAYALETIHHKARELVNKAGFTEDDVDDIEQEMALDLVERLPKFDPAKATNNTFVARLVDRKISSLIRTRLREMRDPDREECSLSDAVNEEDGVKVELGASISEDEHDLRTGKYNRPSVKRQDLSLDVAEMISDLPPELQPIAEALASMSVKEAGRKLGIPRWKLHEVYVPALREAFAARGLAEYL
jgi:RNA polymerase sigma-70 factor (ECF subfamily)